MKSRLQEVNVTFRKKVEEKKNCADNGLEAPGLGMEWFRKLDKSGKSKLDGGTYRVMWE